ncbi:hypothetical protein OO013_05110 [Mangrovivirga sp. M17]|uniref:Uncharacterized protein n=1 Tax=Mangrovivirga halotolerans TaxID=2993936 RepID=A0ABT3RNR3_9BACT|nr:hypothetical protein [Mangrovivirga halotolerans]MCX2743232.1 hypothetical protein [Mangrovivirga halotolerans]
MKNLILLSKAMLLILIVACSNTETIDSITPGLNLKSATGASENLVKREAPETFEWFIHEQYLNNELYRLREKEAQLLEEIENGNENAVPQLEAVQEAIALNENYLDYVAIKIDPLPPPPKPNPCEYGNCPIDVLIEHVFSATEEQGEISFSIVNNDNESIGEVTDVYESEEPYRINYVYESGTVGEFTLRITKYFEPADGEITYEIPVIVN